MFKTHPYLFLLQSGSRVHRFFRDFLLQRKWLCILSYGISKPDVIYYKR